MKKILLLLLILIFIPKAYADETIQARVNSYYKHPVTNKVEDSGNNMEIGQGMTQTVIDSKAMIQSKDSKLYATVKFNLAGHISDIKLSTQERNQSGFNPVKYEVIGKSEEAMDLKFEIPSKTAIVRVAFFVEPMGRDVIFFFDFSGFKTVSSDKSKEKKPASQNKPLSQPKVQQSLQASQGQNQAVIEPKVRQDAKKESLQAQESPIFQKDESPTQNIKNINIYMGENSTSKSYDTQDDTDNSNTKTDDEISQEKKDSLNIENIGYNHGLLMKNSKELQNYYSNDNDSEQTLDKQNFDKKDKLSPDEETKAKMGDMTSFMIKAVIVFLIVIGAILFFIAVIMIIIAKFLRQANAREEEKLYD